MIFLARILALFALAAAACARADEPIRAAPPDGDAAWAAIEPKVGPATQPAETTKGSAVVPADDRTIRRGTPVAKAGTSASSDGSGGWVRSLGALGAVVGVILFLSWGYKATAGGTALRMRARRPGLIQIISRTNLSSRQSFCLVRVGPRMVLVGVSGDALRTLDVIDDADLVGRLAGEAETQAASPAFKAALERDLSRYEAEPAPPARAPSNTRSRIAQLLGTLARAKGPA